jgi:hypothetical protein
VAACYGLIVHVTDGKTLLYISMPWRHTWDVWRWEVNFTFRPLYLRKRPPVPIMYKAVRASRPFRRKEWVLVPAGVRIQDHPDGVTVTILSTLLILFIWVLWKVKISPWHACADTDGRRTYSSDTFATSNLEGAEWSVAHPGRFILGKTRHSLCRWQGGLRGHSG